MVLHPVLDEAPNSAGGCVPAWQVIERTQKQLANEYWLVTQPDHAALAGALASRMTAPGFPTVDPLVARAIGVHDSGWAIFDSEDRSGPAPIVNRRGKPVSFLEIEPADFLHAWTASIDRAESVCPAGGYTVSRHFCALGEGRLGARIDTPEDSALIQAFLHYEGKRRCHLQPLTGRSTGELENILLVLQFCDLLSLYLCCGASDAVEFPQPFAPGRIRARREKQVFILEPSPFRKTKDDAELSLAVEARRCPTRVAPNTTTLAFLLC